MDDPVQVLRMAERIIAVLIGGFSIYLGYRLFFHLPFDTSQKGELVLPGVKIVLSRVGPGVFFGAFGALVLYYSLTTPVKIDKEGFVGAGMMPGQSGVAAAVAVTPQQRNKALTSIEMLNCAERMLRKESNEELATKLSLAIRDAKRVLLLSVWNADDWGPAERLSVSGPGEDAPFGLRTRFNTVYGDCPR